MRNLSLYIWDKSHLSCSFNLSSQFPLMFTASSRDSTRSYLSRFYYEFLQDFRILIIYFQFWIFTKSTESFFKKSIAFGSVWFFRRVSHLLLVPLLSWVRSEMVFLHLLRILFQVFEFCLLQFQQLFWAYHLYLASCVL